MNNRQKAVSVSRFTRPTIVTGLDLVKVYNVAGYTLIL